MKFNPPPKLGSITMTNIGQYLQNQLWSWIQNVFTGLTRLDLQQNFRSAVVTQTIPIMSGSATFTNPFGVIPLYRLIVRQIGNGLITDGDWTAQNLTLINNGPDDVTVTVIYYL